MIPLTVKEKKSYHKQNVCYMCKKGFSNDNHKKNKNTIKPEIVVIILENKEQPAHNVCNLRYKITKKKQTCSIP